MKIVLTSIGTIGDVQPILALAVALAKAGHDPTVALSPNYAERAHELDLPFASIGPPLRADVVRRGNARLGALPTAAEQTRYFLEAVALEAPQMFADLKQCCLAADILVSVAHQFVGRMVHDALGIPFVTISLGHFGTLGSRDLKAASALVINACRQREGLPSLDDPLSNDGLSTQLALFAVTDLILQPQLDWPPHRRVTGFFFLEEEWKPEKRLTDFLHAGSPPVIFSFSSMMHEYPSAITTLAVNASKRLGRRAIILGGWSGLAEGAMLPPHVLGMPGFVPHSWLFPRGSCVVHHGGAGTSAAAMSAGVPSVIIPHFLDQPIWAELVRGLGCAGRALPFSSLTCERLVAVLGTTLDDPKYRRAAVTVGQHIRAENGVVKARRWIEELGNETVPAHIAGVHC